ncbi:MAG: lysine transporter LysE [Fulvimarina sp.]|nr:lysine transporter LysE [Fulvimarina sp.]
MTAAALTPFLAYAAALGIAAFIPGPGVAGLVGQSLGNGLRAALFFLAGIALGDVVYLTVAVAGLAALAELFAEALLVVKILGGAYLVYLAVLFWRSEGGLARIEASRERSGRKAFLAGFAVTLGNPKTIVFYLALLPSVLDLRAVGIGQWSVLAPLTVLVLFAVLSPYALLGAKARGLMMRPQAVRRLERVAGGVIGGAGALILGEAAVAAWRRM